MEDKIQNDKNKKLGDEVLKDIQASGASLKPEFIDIITEKANTNNN